MHAGTLTREELARWVVNRFYYQTRIPIKDALILSKSEDRAFRRGWIRRIHDHDGDDHGGDGGLAEWTPPRRGARVDRRLDHQRPPRASGRAIRVRCLRDVGAGQPARRGGRLVAHGVLRARPHVSPIAAWETHYPFVDPAGLAYFRARVPRARRDSEEAIRFVVAEATTPDLQDACVAALIRKTEILWHLLDCVAAPTSARLPLGPPRSGEPPASGDGAPR